MAPTEESAATNGNVTAHSFVENGHENKAYAFTISDPVTDDQGQNEKKNEAQVNSADFPKPLWLCKIACERPKTCFGITLSMHLVMLVITAVLIQTGYDIIPFRLEQLPLFLNDHPDYRYGMAWANRDADTDIIDPTNFNRADVPPRTKISSPIQIYFDAGAGNVFTKENLQLIKQAEDDLFNATFQNDFCFKVMNFCTKPASILRFFDGTYARYDPVFNDPNFDNIVGVLNKANETRVLDAQLKGYLGINAFITPTEVKSTITRMTMLIGGPFSGYSNLTDRESEQKDRVKEHVMTNMKPKFDSWYSDGLGPQMVVYPFSSDLISGYIQRQAIMDMSLALGSMVFIGAFLVFQTGSTWIAGLGTLSIVTSFTWANLLYRVVLDYRFFGTFHILSIFIILGIGADDFFVFLDTWKLSAHTEYPSMAHRLSAVYRKACAAMLFTSLTTAVAFFISGASPLLAINSFGLFSGILVLVNYLSVITFFPCVVVTYHFYWSGPCCCCCGGCCGKPALVDDGSTTVLKKNVIVRFFAGPYYKFILHPVSKVACIVVSLASIIFFGIYAGQLKPNDAETEFLPATTSLGKFLKASTTRFMPSDADRTLAVYVVWGMEGQDRSSCHKTDYKCNGETIWDPNFNLNTEQAQNDILNFCDKLKSNLTDQQISDLRIRINDLTNKPEVACFIYELDTYMTNEQDDTVKYAGGSLALPTDENSIKNVLMNNNPDLYNMTTLNSSFNRWFEIGLQHWLYSAYNTSTMLRSEHFKRYEPLLGSSEYEHSYPIVTQPFPDATIRYGTKLRYAAIMINTTLLIRNLAFMEGLPIRNRWEEFIAVEIAQMSEPLRRGFMTSTNSFTGSVWHWLQVQQILVSSAINGIIIGICVAFPILLIATMNVLVALYATVIIGCITMSVVGTIPLAGWKLGTLESLNLVLVVGLAVDYVVHLAEGYCRSTKLDRKGRLRDMLEEVGISVLSGAVTTLGSSLFLFMAVITFFKQFGAFMFATIGFSIFYSLVLFVATLSVIGPEGNVGSLKPLWNWLVKCVREKAGDVSNEFP